MATARPRVLIATEAGVVGPPARRTPAETEARAREAWARLPGGRPEPDPEDVAAVVATCAAEGLFGELADGLAMVAGRRLRPDAARAAEIRVRALVRSEEWRRDFAHTALTHAACRALDRLEAEVAAGELAGLGGDAFALHFLARYHEAAVIEEALGQAAQAAVDAFCHEIGG